ncbi:MAG: DUF4832 domain-containing protein [Anaerolineales bacterium]|nr:DUF4832 domain-containing protein [Anaerolineales bacterium]
MRHSTSRFLLSIFLLSSFLTGCQPASSAPEPAPVTHAYSASDASILNPERGFFTPYALPGSAGFSPVRATGNTLVHLNINFDNWRETDIPQDVLDGLQVNFDDIRDGGVKAIVRFIYNLGPYPDTEPDASKEQILRHIEQLTPLLQNNTDVIAWLEAGFIGAWGEWHTSTNGLDNITDKRDILNALVDAIPNRYVQVRYPANIIEMYPNPADAASARVAHHNDCFLSSNTDVGTYERDGTITIERDQAYLAELTRFTPMSGESCAPNPPRSECAVALQEMEMLHFSAINEAYHKGILRSWEEGGCYEEISNRMGYRLALTTADFNEQVVPGGVLNLTVNLENTGFASIVNERGLYVVLTGADTASPYKVKLDIDPRQWEPGTTTFTAKLHIPSNAKDGEYQLALWLPDGYDSLRDNPLYAIQFANENIWDEATGLNALGNILVTESAGGESERGKEFTVISAESQTVRDVTSPVLDEVPTVEVVATSTPEVVVDSLSLISEIQILNQTSFLTIKFAFAGKAEDYNGYQTFLDTDQNSSTGYGVNGIGADYLLENGVLNQYAGSGSDWTWTPTDDEILFDNAGNSAQWLFNSEGLGKPAAIDFVCQLVDVNWNAVSTTSKQTYTLK